MSVGLQTSSASNSGTESSGAASVKSHSTVTDLAKLRGLSTLRPRSLATWYANS